MASNASIPARGLPPKPPDKGSFPLDHFRECSEAKTKYVDCLKAHGMKANAEECRQLSAAYLQCRMDTQLMAKEDVKKLGFFDEGKAAAAASQGGAAAPAGETQEQSEARNANRQGFIAGLRPERTAAGVWGAGSSQAEKR